MLNILYKVLPRSVKESIKRRSGAPDMFLSLERLRNIGFNPKEIVDVGAYEGEWTSQCAAIFPQAHFTMVEAMEQKQDKLQQIAARTNAHVAIAVLGARDGEAVYFTELETASSVLEETAATHDGRKKRTTTTLNEVIKQNNIGKIDLLKLDVQGYELEVLKGFDKYLSATDVVLSEVSLLDIHKGVPLIKDVINFMYDYGFVVYDICSATTRRPLDSALWQTDLLFVKEQSPFRADKRYNA
jgi:FkbM family methyltransferase